MRCPVIRREVPRLLIRKSHSCFVLHISSSTALVTNIALIVCEVPRAEGAENRTMISARPLTNATSAVTGSIFSERAYRDAIDKFNLGKVNSEVSKLRNDP